MVVNTEMLARQGVVVALVLFRRRLDEVTSWPVLLRWLESRALRQCVVYDNSPVPSVDAATLPPDVVLIHDPTNGGTAAAYVAAATAAAQLKCEWLLLLDQDTMLPAEYLCHATSALSAVPHAAALVPRVRHDGHLVSPATISRLGSVRPSARPDARNGLVTAISSGVFIRRQLVSDTAFPPEVWLDYVDHWLFLNIFNGGESIALMDVDLAHDLSVRHPATLSIERLRSIVAAEKAFFVRLGGVGRHILPLRLLLRGLRFVLAGRPALASVVFRMGFNTPDAVNRD